MSDHGIDGLGEYLEKAKRGGGKGGPFVGPKGGLWADPKHTVHWDPKVHGPGQLSLPARTPVAAPPAAAGGKVAGELAPFPHIPNRQEVEGLKVGDLAVNAFGRWAPVAEVTFRGTDGHGKAYVGYSTGTAGGGTTSMSIKEDELTRHVSASGRHTSAELDRIEWEAVAPERRHGGMRGAPLGFKVAEEKRVREGAKTFRQPTAAEMANIHSVEEMVPFIGVEEANRRAAAGHTAAVNLSNQERDKAHAEWKRLTNVGHGRDSPALQAARTRAQMHSLLADHHQAARASIDPKLNDTERLQHLRDAGRFKKEANQVEAEHAVHADRMHREAKINPANLPLSQLVSEGHQAVTAAGNAAYGTQEKSNLHADAASSYDIAGGVAAIRGDTVAAQGYYDAAKQQRTLQSDHAIIAKHREREKALAVPPKSSSVVGASAQQALKEHQENVIKKLGMRDQIGHETYDAKASHAAYAKLARLHEGVGKEAKAAGDTVQWAQSKRFAKYAKGQAAMHRNMIAKKSLDGIDGLDEFVRKGFSAATKRDPVREKIEHEASSPPPIEKGDVTPEKARQILHDGTVHGKPLTEQQRKFFGAIGGHLPAPKAEKSMQKAEGEGTRGGHVIGHTSGGKPIYAATHPKYHEGKSKPKWNKKPTALEHPGVMREQHPDYGKQDHEDAARAHAKHKDQLQAEHSKVRDAAEKQHYGRKLGIGEGPNISGGVDPKFGDKTNDKLRDLAHAATHASRASQMHWQAAGKRKTMEKSMTGIDALGEYLAKADTSTSSPQPNAGEAGKIPGDGSEGVGPLPHGEPGLEGAGGANGGKLEGAGKGDVGSGPNPPPTKGEKAEDGALSDDDVDVEQEMKPAGDNKFRGGQERMLSAKSLDNSYTQQELRHTVAHDNAIVASRLRKGPEDIIVKGGTPPTPVAPEREQPTTFRHGDVVTYSNAADLACEAIQKGDDFYHGPPPAIDATGTLRKSTTCAHGHTMSAALSACPQCGEGATMAKSDAAVPDGVTLRNFGRGLMPRHEPDLVLPNGTTKPDQK